MFRAASRAAIAFDPPSCATQRAPDDLNARTYAVVKARLEQFRAVDPRTAVISILPFTRRPGLLLAPNSSLPATAASRPGAP